MKTMENVHTPAVLSAGTITGDGVRSIEGEKLGKIEEIMLDMHSGRIAYAVLSFGGFMGLGDKFFAIPWSLLTLDADNHEFILNVSKDQLKKAPGFDKNNWPDHADQRWMSDIYSYYDVAPYW